MEALVLFGILAVAIVSFLIMSHRVVHGTKKNMKQ
jgi:hypothetical protein